MLRKAAATAALAFVLAVPAGAQGPDVAIVAPDKLALTHDGRTTATASVWVRNGTDTAWAPRFRASVEAADGTLTPLEVVLVDDAGEQMSQDQDLEPHDVTRRRLFLRAPKSTTLAEASGELIISGDGSVHSLPLSIAEATSASQDVVVALLIPLVPALILVFWGGKLAVKDALEYQHRLPSDLDFSTSFASTLTAVGALLGTVIAADALPEDTATLSKAGFVALNLIFGFGIVVAGLVYSAFQRGVWTDVETEDEGQPQLQQRKLQGTVRGFLVASFITVWAVYGELLATWLLLAELGQDQGFSAAALWIFRSLLIGTALTMAVYTVRRIPVIVRSERAATGASTSGVVPSRDAEPERPVALL